MGTLQRIITLVMSVLLIMSVSAVNSETENLLTNLENSEVSIYAASSSYVYHMEIDKYKPGYVIYIDKHALKTTDGNTTENIAGQSAERGYKEGVGEDARFKYIEGFTQISPTQLVISDTSNHCLRQVDRVTRVTSVFAGQCQSPGYQDGASISAEFYLPRAIMVDKKNSTQLLAVDYFNKAVRTVDVESRRVGTFTEAYELDSMKDFVQDNNTGDIYITNHETLYKLSYSTRYVDAVGYGTTGQIDGQTPNHLRSVFMIETVLLVTDTSNARILEYDTQLDTWSTLKACNVNTTSTNTDGCVIESPWSILLTSNRLLIGGTKKITSYKPVCQSRSITEYTDSHTGTARVEILSGYNVILTEGSYTFETPGPMNHTCTTAVHIINSLAVTETVTPPIPHSTVTVCTDRNITVYTDTNTETARVELAEGLTYIDLSEGTHVYETRTEHNTSCITTFHVINNRTDTPPKTFSCPESQVALISPLNGLARFQLKFGDQHQVLLLPLGQHPYIITSANHTCNVTLNAEDYRVRHTLELVTDYSVDCRVVNSTVTWSLLKDVAQQKYTLIEALCGSVCSKPGDNTRAIISCDGVDNLRIRWPTDLSFTADVVSVPADIRQALEIRINQPGVTMDVVVFGATPPIVYPRKAANGGYISIALSTTCINGLSYSNIEKKCV